MLANFFFSLLRNQSRMRVLGIALLLLLLVGWLDYLTGLDLVFDIFYLLPVTIAAWFVGRNVGFIFALASGVIVFLANLGVNNPNLISTELWNVFARLTFFMVFAQLSSILGNKLEHETQLARTDFLTGASNTRAFYDQAQMEMSRLQRSGQPLSIAYIDLDNFKKVNDTRGHSEGDRVLKTVVETLKQTLRGGDFIARLGGDEFAVLLPSTNDVQSRALMKRLHTILLKASDSYGWPVTFSIGVITCLEAPASLESFVAKADELMYKVKASGKNAILHSTFRTSLNKDSSYTQQDLTRES
jgi:diguanylate cyclase (GGDEF)-like protein